MNNKGEFITERSHPDNGGSDRTQPTSYTLPIIPYITSYTLPSDSHTRFTSPYCLSFSELPWWIMNWSVNVPTMCAFKQNTLWCVVQCGFTLLVLTRMVQPGETLGGLQCLVLFQRRQNISTGWRSIVTDLQCGQTGGSLAWGIHSRKLLLYLI